MGVPMMGKRIPVRLMPSFTWGLLVPGPIQPGLIRSRFSKKAADADRSSGRVLSDSRAGYRPSWQFGKRDEENTEDVEKRNPWTGSWANIVWRPDLTQPTTVDKRSPWNANRATLWPPRFTAVGPGKRSPLPRTWSRGPKGFRYHADSPSWLSHDLMFKRMNDVPMMGKREDMMEYQDAAM